jgi:hypothetical protein
MDPRRWSKYEFRVTGLIAIRVGAEREEHSPVTAIGTDN